MKIIGYSSKTSFFYKRNRDDFPNWRLQYLYNCTSTENILDKYLSTYRFSKNNPIAIFSKKQTSGVGQYGRKWLSPKGGLWFSALYPVFSANFLPKIFPVSLSYKLCEMLLNESVQANIKWPNDILYGSKKLIGFLPKVITRGNKTLYVRIGFGMNLNNKTPEEGISLSEILNKKELCEHYWASEILKVICDSIRYNNQRELMIAGGNKFLNKKILPKNHSEKDWAIQKIDLQGNLKIFNKKNEYKIIKFI